MPSTSAARRASAASSREQQPREPVRSAAGVSRQRQVHPDDVVPGVDGPRGGHRGVDAAAHRGQNSHRPAPRQRIGLRLPRPPGPVDDRPDHRGHRVDVVRGGGVPEREAQRAARRRLVRTHRQQHVAGLRHPGRAGRAGGALDAVRVEQHEQAVALAAGEGQVRVARQPRRPAVDRAGAGVAVEQRVRHGGQHLADEVVAQPGEHRGPPRGVGHRHLDGRGERRRSPGVSSVPERTSRSWPPPCSSGVSVDLAAAAAARRPRRGRRACGRSG